MECGGKAGREQDQVARVGHDRGNRTAEVRKLAQDLFLVKKTKDPGALLQSTDRMWRIIDLR